MKSNRFHLVSAVLLLISTLFLLMACAPTVTPDASSRQIRGQVWEERFANGIREDKEPPMYEIRLDMFSQQRGEDDNFVRLATTWTEKPDGAYSFDVPEEIAGDVIIVIYPPDGWRLTEQDAGNNERANDQVDSDFDPGLRQVVVPPGLAHVDAGLIEPLDEATPTPTMAPSATPQPTVTVSPTPTPSPTPEPDDAADGETGQLPGIGLEYRACRTGSAVDLSPEPALGVDVGEGTAEWSGYLTVRFINGLDFPGDNDGFIQLGADFTAGGPSPNGSGYAVTLGSGGVTAVTAGRVTDDGSVIPQNTGAVARTDDETGNVLLHVPLRELGIFDKVRFGMQDGELCADSRDAADDDGFRPITTLSLPALTTAAEQVRSRFVCSVPISTCVAVPVEALTARVDPQTWKVSAPVSGTVVTTTLQLGAAQGVLPTLYGIWTSADWTVGDPIVHAAPTGNWPISFLSANGSTYGILAGSEIETGAGPVVLSVTLLDDAPLSGEQQRLWLEFATGLLDTHQTGLK